MLNVHVGGWWVGGLLYHQDNWFLKEDEGKPWNLPCPLCLILAYCRSLEPILTPSTATSDGSV